MRGSTHVQHMFNGTHAQFRANWEDLYNFSFFFPLILSQREYFLNCDFFLKFCILILFLIENNFLYSSYKKWNVIYPNWCIDAKTYGDRQTKFYWSHFYQVSIPTPSWMFQKIINDTDFNVNYIFRRKENLSTFNIQDKFHNPIWNHIRLHKVLGNSNISLQKYFLK